MRNISRLYYYSVFGALGGATGWFLAETFFPSFGGGLSLGNRAGHGALIGAMIGLSLAAYDASSGGSVVRLLWYSGGGFLLGAAAGAVALPLAFRLYPVLLGMATDAGGRGGSSFTGFVVGVMCWILMGGIIGFGEGIGKGTENYKGALGGAAGGLAGGIFCEIARLFAVTQTTPHVLLAVSMTILGGSIGGSIAIVTKALRKAWVEVFREGVFIREIPVDKYVHPRLGKYKPGVIGSASSANIYLPGDAGIAPRHAKITNVDGVPTLVVLGEPGNGHEATVNGYAVMNSPLRNGYRIRIGSTTLLFKQKRIARKKSSEGALGSPEAGEGRPQPVAGPRA